MPKWLVTRQYLKVVDHIFYRRIGLIFMKYQDSSTSAHSDKISSLIARLKPCRTTSQMYSKSKITVDTENSTRSKSIKQPDLCPLTVDVLSQRTQNILLYIPRPDQNPPWTMNKSSRIRSLRGSKFSFPSQSKLLVRSIPVSRSTFRVKRLKTQREDSEQFGLTQSKTLLQWCLKPELTQSRVLQPVPQLKTEATSRAQKLKSKRLREKQVEVKPCIEQHLLKHKLLGEFLQRFQSVQKDACLEQETGYVSLKELLIDKSRPLFPHVVNSQVTSQNNHLSYFLNMLYSYNPQLIKRLFAQNKAHVNLTINYEGCFRALKAKYLQHPQHNMVLKDKMGSIWANILCQPLTTLFRCDVGAMDMGHLYEMVTGLVIRKEVVSVCSDQKLLQMVCSIKDRQCLMIGETKDETLSLVSYRKGQVTVQKQVVQSVYSELTSSAQQLVPTLRSDYSCIYVLDLFPHYNFVYKRVQYSLGQDSVIRFQVPYELNLIVQASRQTLAFDSSIQISVEQYREDGLHVLEKGLLKSDAGFNTNMRFHPGVYYVRLSDRSHCLLEYSFGLILGFVSKEDIGNLIGQSSKG